MNNENDRELTEMKARLNCLVKVGDWGVAYGVSWTVLCWGKIISSGGQALVLKTVPGRHEESWDRKYVEVFPSCEEAFERFRKQSEIPDEKGLMFCNKKKKGEKL